MDDFYTGLVESLEQARQKKARLQKELEVTDFLIQAQEQAISLYGNNGSEAAPKRQRARRGDKMQVVVSALRDEPFGISRDELFEAVKEEGIDRNYLGKLLSRLIKAEKIKFEGEKIFWID